jgi:MFS family permease
VAPDFFGRGDAFWGDWLRVEYGYIGVITLFMAAVAVILRPNRQTFFFLLAGLFFLLLALGPATPLYPLLGRLLPSFPFQVPARFVLLLNFSLATLGAIGLDALMDAQKKDWRLIWLLGGSALAGFGVLAILLIMRAGLSEIEPQRGGQMARSAIVFAALAAGSWLILGSALSRRVTPAILALAAIGLLFVDLYGLGRHVEIERNNPMPGFAEDSAALAYLKDDPGIHRVDIITDAWQPNMPMIEGLFAARGVYNPLQLANYNVYMGSVGFRGSILYNLMGIKYLIGGKKEPPGDTNFIIPVYEADPAVTVYLNTLALPRALVVFNSEVVANHDDAFNTVHADGFDPSQLVVLEGGQQLFQEPGQATIEIMRYDGNEVAFDVTTDRAGYFVLSDVFHPDWRAEVDGVPSAIEVANYAFRAIYLEAGNHIVTMHFLPSGWIAGVVATGLALITLIALGTQQARNYRKLSISPADEPFSR